MNIVFFIKILTRLEDVSLHELHHHLVLHGHVPDEVELNTRLNVPTVWTDSTPITADSLRENVNVRCWRGERKLTSDVELLQLLPVVTNCQQLLGVALSGAVDDWTGEVLVILVYGDEGR